MGQKQREAQFGDDVTGAPKPKVEMPKGASNKAPDFGALLRDATSEKEDTKGDKAQKPKTKKKKTVKTRVVCPICRDPSCYLGHDEEVDTYE